MFCTLAVQEGLFRGDSLTRTVQVLAPSVCSVALSQSFAKFISKFGRTQREEISPKFGSISRQSSFRTISGFQYEEARCGVGAAGDLYKVQQGPASKVQAGRYR